MSDNVKRAIEQKLRKGEWPCKAPYDYNNISLDGDKADIIVDEYATAILRKAFELYATGAYLIELLCKKLKDEYNVDWGTSYIDKVFNQQVFVAQFFVNKVFYLL